MLRPCRNCGDHVTIRDEREGLIHVNGLYICKLYKTKKLMAAE